MSGDNPEYCPRCGHETPAHGDFCAACGADLTAFVEGADQQPTEGEQTGERRSSHDGPVIEEPTAENESRTRREILKYAGAGVIGLGIAGVAIQFLNDSSMNHRVAPRSVWDDATSHTTNGAEGVRATIKLEEGQFTGRTYRTWGNAGILAAVNILSGSSLDVFTFHKDEMSAYRSGDDSVSFIGELTERGVESQTELLSRTNDGEYVVVFDNTPAYGTLPTGQVEFEAFVAAGRM